MRWSYFISIPALSLNLQNIMQIIIKFLYLSEILIANHKTLIQYT